MILAAGIPLTAQTASQSTQQTAPSPTVTVVPVTPAAGPITKEQAQELLRSVDEILDFASNDSKLPLLHPVKRVIISRETFNQSLIKKMSDDKSAQRLQRSEIVLKKFGLLDHDFHLGPFLLSLLTEQVGGYYEPKNKTVYLLDWLAPEEQKPVLAHELTHALQDQHVDLEKWSEVTHYDVARNAVEDNEHIQTDEADTAREAVLEGQAMVVFADYGLQEAHKTLLTDPEIAQKMEDAMSDNGDSPVMARAPLVLQQSLIFPYREGLGFEAAILASRGVNDAFAGVLDRPPSSSYEIIHPDAYIAHLPVPVLRMPDVHPLLDKDYVPYDVGVMGELDVRMLTELFAGSQQADALAPAWDGGIYYAAQRRSAKTDEEKASTASLGLIYYSRWKNSDTARSFARVYVGELPRKYTSLVRRQADEKDEDEQIYTTPEGDVLVQIADNGVFVSEGFDLTLARKLSDAIVNAQAGGPVQQASAPDHELTLGMAQDLERFGVPQAAMLHVAITH
ncbi:MAG TPA: hypothetical protein VNU94_06860 [Acidobacteriaceae bacterium]|nr:hypothetical protein [Acidobacteriaceae bacterium]